MLCIYARHNICVRYVGTLSVRCIFSFGTLVLSLYNNRCHFIKIIILLVDVSCVAHYLGRYSIFVLRCRARARNISDNTTTSLEIISTGLPFAIGVALKRMNCVCVCMCVQIATGSTTIGARWRQFGRVSRDIRYRHVVCSLRHSHVQPKIEEKIINDWINK